MATLWIRNKPDIYWDGKPIKLRWSIIQVDPDSRRFARMTGHWGKDMPNNGRDNYIFYRLHVPGMSPLMKYFIELPHKAERQAWGEFTEEPENIYPRRYYLDYDALPDWAKVSMQCEGECTLPPHIAYQVIKRRADEEPDARLLTHFRAVT